MLRSFFHWKVFVNLIVALVIFVGVVWLTFRWLEFHTNHGEEIQVPNVVNMKVQQAIEVLDDQGLEYEVDSFKYDPKFKPYQVLQIYPSPGSRVKDGRTIVLKVNPKTYAPVAVPDVLDRYKYLAFRKFDLLGLKVGDTIYEPNIQKDAVIRMMFNGRVIKPGEKVPMYSTLDLVIGSGPMRNVVIPKLVEYEDGQNNDSDIIYYQDPASGSVRDQGMQIDLWASKKTPAEMQSKIQKLNSIYRTTDINAMPEPSDNEFIPVPSEEPVNTTPKPPVEKPKPTTNTNSTKPTETKPAEEKPAKKVIVE